jgi:hypothetical protein
MRGALFYGLDFIRRDELTDIDQTPFDDKHDQSFKANDHEVLISIGKPVTLYIYKNIAC